MQFCYIQTTKSVVLYQRVFFVIWNGVCEMGYLLEGLMYVDFTDVLIETIIDSAKLLPFLFLTYVLMEYMEHHTGNKMVTLLKKSGRFGPVIGALAGVIPQCGFSAAASGLYAGRVISLGSLMAIYLSTSDEMLPLLISSQASPEVIGSILGIKVLTGMIAGFVIDGVCHLKNKEKDEEYHIHEMCEHEHCHCEDGVLKSALRHTLKVFLFVFITTFLLTYFMDAIGVAGIQYVTIGESYGVIVLASLAGLIPNCATSVALTELYMGGMLSSAALIAGLLVGAGVGILVLLRVNKNLKDNIKIIALLWLIGLGVLAAC